MRIAGLGELIMQRPVDELRPTQDSGRNKKAQGAVNARPRETPSLSTKPETQGFGVEVPGRVQDRI